MSWRGAARTAASALVERPGLVAIGLAGFLARGGLLLFALPVVVFPTTVGIGNWVGATSLTASGPTESLVWRLAVIAVAAMLTLVAGVLIGAAADLLLFREARARLAEHEGRPVGRALALRPVVLIRLATIRLVASIPAFAAVAWASTQVAAVAYHELILPEELATPLVVRVIYESRDVLAVVVATWLACETLGGLAVRHHLLRGDPAPVALLRPALDLVMRPATTAWTTVLGIAVAAVAIAPPLFVAWAVWNRLRLALLIGDALPLAVLTITFVALWMLALVAAGVVASWRSLTWSLEVLRTRGAALPVASGLPLPAAPLERAPGRPAA